MGKKKQSEWPGAVTVSDACLVFRVTPQAFAGWIKNGCPCGEKHKLNIADVYKWLMDREKKLNADGGGLHKQKLEKEIEHLTAKINKVNESVIPVDEHKNILRNLAASYKKFWENAANKNYHQLANRSPEEMHVMLMEFGRQLMKVWIGEK